MISSQGYSSYIPPNELHGGCKREPHESPKERNIVPMFNSMRLPPDCDSSYPNPVFPQSSITQPIDLLYSCPTDQQQSQRFSPNVILL